MGRLIYIVGASGSGKDSLLNAARAELDEAVPLIIAHRYITRPPDPEGENFISLNCREFSMREKAGLFAMSWSAHGKRYGVGIEINSWLEKGFLVAVNGSREYLSEASRLYKNITVCLINVSQDKLRDRLIERGRENLEDIKKRLERADSFTIGHNCLEVINNDSTIEKAVEQFFKIINKQLTN